MIDKDQLEQEIQFELDFCSYIAKTEDYNILTLPVDINTNKRLTFDEIRSISIDCKKHNIKLLYRISLHDKYALVFTEDMDLIGMVPDGDHRGFHC